MRAVFLHGSRFARQGPGSLVQVRQTGCTHMSMAGLAGLRPRELAAQPVAEPPAHKSRANRLVQRQ